jgi:hypothetical protein
MGGRGRASLILAAVLATAAGGCAGSPSRAHGMKQLKAMSDRPEAVLQLRRAGCAPDDCPVYSVSVFMDGTLIYEGRSNVAVVGERRARLSPQRLNALIGAAGEAHFLDMPESCCVCPDAKRSRLVMIDYRPGFSQQSVLHDEGCKSAPPAMSAFANAIERLTEVHRWTTASRGAGPASVLAPVTGDREVAVGSVGVAGDEDADGRDPLVDLQ